MAERSRGLARWGVLALILITAGVTACGKMPTQPQTAAQPQAPARQQAQSKPQAPQVVRFGVQPSTQPPYIARATGFLAEVEKKYGTRIEFLTFPYGGPQNSAMAAGEIDFSQIGMAPATVAAEKSKAKLLAINILEQTAIVAGPTIQTVADLKGKAVAFPGKGSQQYPLLLLALEKAGLKESDINLVRMDAVNMATALDKGEIAAYIAWDPHTTKALVDGKNHVLVRAEQLMPLKDGHYLGEGVVVREEFVNKYPELTRDVVRALARTNEYILNNLDKVPRMWSEAIKLDERIIQYSIKNNMVVYPEDITPDSKALKPYVEMLKKYGIVEVKDVERFLQQQVDTQFTVTR